MSESSLKLLRNMPIFGGLKESALELILQASSTFTLAEDDFLFQEGDRAESVFVLKSGSVTIEKRLNGEPIQLGHLSEGDCIGEMALIDMQARSASVRANCQCEILEIPARSLRNLLKDDLEQYAMIMMNMGREVSRRLRRADERLLEMMLQQQTQQQQ